MKPSWFRSRGYKHFDAPVGEAFAAKASNPAFVERHDWSPLIHYIKSIKRYKPLLRTTELKNRSIMYASHRDACILSKYAADLNSMLEDRYKTDGLDTSVIAYRSLGKANYHFSADAARFAIELSPCIVWCFDITGFFDNLDHFIIKTRLKELLGVTEIPTHWYKVYRHVTAFRKIERDALIAQPALNARLKRRDAEPVATMAEIKSLGIGIAENRNKFGIPQGTPISSSLSNLYMLHVDKAVKDACDSCGALYQRYSDDLIIICKEEAEDYLYNILLKRIGEHKLNVHPGKCERVVFDVGSPAAFQYLGFDVSPDGAIIRASSLSRQWRKLNRSIKKAKNRRSKLKSAGISTPLYTKKLRRRFSPIGVRNFSSYARRAATSFESSKIRRQVKRLESKADREIRALIEPRKIEDD